MSETTIYLVRHAESAPNPALPEAEWPLSPLGRRQAIMLIEPLGQTAPTAIYSSPFVRARATVQPTADHLGLEIDEISDLRERCLCPEPRDDWLSLLNQAWLEPDFKVDGGESNRDARRRISAAVGVIAAGHVGEVVVVASHGNVIALLLGEIDGKFGFAGWKTLRNPDVLRLRYGDAVRSWVRMEIPRSL